MKNLDPARAKWIRVRMGMLCGAMAIGLGGFVNSAYRVQVEDHKQWEETAENQRQQRLHIEPKRGGIYDRNGAALAQSIDVPSVSGDVVEMLRGIEGQNAQSAALIDFAQRIGKTLSIDPSEVHQKLATRRRFVSIKRRVSADETKAIQDLGDAKKTPIPIHGLAIEGEGHRYYPGRELAGAVLGFVAPDGYGKDGLELSLDDELRGHVEEVRGLRDRSGRLILSEGTGDEASLGGHDVTLSLDEAIQRVSERELDTAYRTYEPKGASIVVMEPNTGEILALASTPGFNPNDYGDSDADARRDRAVTDRFEPGSVMKIFTVAAALAAGTLKPTEAIFCEHGQYQLGNVTIHDTHDNEWLTPTQILARSSNIGALKIGLGLGEPGLYGSFRKFGFGEPTGLPIPGEASGVLRPRGRPWFEVETANAAFGQGISVTTIQLATAMSAIANGGKVMEPILVRKVTDTKGNTIKEWAPRVRRDAIPAATAKMVTEMLTAVVDQDGINNTGKEAAMEGFRVAGKTATSQKPDPATGKYSEDHYVASFLGFVPADKPRLVIAVVIDDPMMGHYGGELAGPVFRRVAEASLRYMGVPPSTVKPAIKDVKASDADPVPTMVAAKVEPPPVVAQVPIGPPLASSQKVPDMTGMGARDAIRAVSSAGLVPVIEGSGKLVRQLPAPGTPVPKGTTVRLVFEPST